MLLSKIDRFATRLLAASALAVPLTLAGQPPAAAQAEPQTGLQEQAVEVDSLRLTLYQGGFGLIQDRRSVDLPAGEVSLRLENLARQAVRESLTLTGPGLRVIEQRPRGGDLGYRALLEAHLGQMVEVRRENPASGESESEAARLIAIDEGPVLEFEDRIETEVPGRIVFPSIPEHLTSAPYLDARLSVAEAGERMLELWYLAEGLAWQAEYTAVLDYDSAELMLSGRASLTNNSGAAFSDAEISLVAGDVSRARHSPPIPMMRAQSMEMAADASLPQAEAAGGYYRYDIKGRIFLPKGQSVQVPLIAADAVSFRREYRVEGLATAQRRGRPSGPQPAQMRLVFDNAEDAGLGQPLPAGTLRVFGTGAGTGNGNGEGGGQPMLLGEATLDHTPVDGQVDVILGASFDVQAEARETAFERLGERNYETAQEIRVTNGGGEEVEVEIAGAFPQGWRMIEESQQHELESSTRPIWTVTVPAGGETTLSYRVRVEH